MRGHVFCEEQLRAIKAVCVIDNLLTQFQLSSLSGVVQTTVFLLVRFEQV